VRVVYPLGWGGGGGPNLDVSAPEFQLSFP
jgi:hypothetical protein